MRRALAGPHGALCSALIAVGFQIHLAHKALPHPAALLGALHIHKAVHGAGEHVLCIIRHRGMDLLHPGVRVAVLQIHLRQDQVQGAGAAVSRFFGPLPVLAVAGELVAGNAAPLFQRDLLRRQKDVRRCKASCGVHGRFLTFPYHQRQLLHHSARNAVGLKAVCGVYGQVLHPCIHGRRFQRLQGIGIHGRVRGHQQVLHA